MCGLSGFFFYKNNNFPHNTRHLLEQTVKALKHRGPDADGIWFNNKHKIGVAQTRLAIQGVGVAADQPMHSVCGNFTVVFNGQLYNHHSLKKQLTNIGAHYRTDSDTETLLHAYQHWGTGCLSLLDGMFAFAIFDKIKNKLFAARDRFGIKPFYFSTQNEIFSFASTLNPLWQLPWIKQKLTQEGQESFLTYMSTPAPLTAFEQVYKLPAGFYAEIESNLSPRFYRWYNLLENLNKTSSQKISQRQCIEKATYLLEKAIKKRVLASQGDGGALLSGGLDSSLIVAIMASIQKKTKTFNISFAKNPASDETSFAREIANMFSTDHFEMIATQETTEKAIESIENQIDDLNGDPVNIPFYLITHHAHSHGLKVLLTGEGADELFFGYRLYQQHALAEKMVPKALIQTIPGLLPLMQKLPISFGKKEALSSLIKSESSFVSGAKAWFDLQLNFSNNNKIWQSDPVLKQIVPNIDTTTNPYAEIFLQSQQQLSKIKNLSYSSKVFFLESQHRLPELLLMRADKISMLSSVENRVPFLDHALVEFVCSLPDAMKIPMLQTKFLLKQVAKKYLPERLIYRHKVGFSAPLEKVTPIVSKANQLFPFLKPKNHLQQWTLRVLQKFIEKQS